MKKFTVKFKVEIVSIYESEIEYEAETAEKAQELADNDHETMTGEACSFGNYDYSVDVGKAEEIA